MFTNIYMSFCEISSSFVIAKTRIRGSLNIFGLGSPCTGPSSKRQNLRHLFRIVIKYRCHLHVKNYYLFLIR